MSQFITTALEGLVIIEPKVWTDSRGYFFEAYNQKDWENAGVSTKFVQDNQSYSKKNVIRGLHYQLNPTPQKKMVRVLKGAILDVVVDIRKSSATYGQHFSIELSADNQKQLYIPEGFAHGFSVLSDDAIVLYKCDKFYDKSCEAGIRFDDATLAIDWKIAAADAIVSDKDRVLPFWSDLVTNFD